MKMLSLAISAAICATVSAVPYPSSFPYENEAYVPPVPPASVPDYIFDDTSQSGGYIHYCAYTLTTHGGDILEEDFPFCFEHNKFTMFVLDFSYNLSPVLPRIAWNCTAKNIVLEASDFSGLAGGKRVCEVGECCESLGIIGMPKFGDDQLVWHKWNDDRLLAAMCPAMDEDIYCLMVAGHIQINCYEYMVSPGERTLDPFTCADNWVLYFLDCAVYKSAYTYMLRWEPAVYVDQNTNEENMMVDSFAFLQDRVCFPYSYYHPVTTKDSTPTNSESSESSTALAALSTLLFIC